MKVDGSEAPGPVRLFDYRPSTPSAEEADCSLGSGGNVRSSCSTVCASDRRLRRGRCPSWRAERPCAWAFARRSSLFCRLALDATCVGDLDLDFCFGLIGFVLVYFLVSDCYSVMLGPWVCFSSIPREITYLLVPRNLDRSITCLRVISFHRHSGFNRFCVPSLHWQAAEKANSGLGRAALKPTPLPKLLRLLGSDLRRPYPNPW